MHALDRGEDLVGIEVGTGHLLLQLVRQHVHEQLGVGIGVEVPTVDVEELFGQLTGVGEVAVVHENDAVGRVHVERLGFLFVRGVAFGGVTAVSEAHVSR